ncbi:CRIB domain-containing protein RIC9-like isoform X2 [Apium graveolens]|uniref:CRIB domain-containing protein RIC9-like isoform X2 n=1 Tax=Apium graveolens TaxID=4045 RepID=UPI003D794F55
MYLFVLGKRCMVVVEEHEMEIGYPTNVKHLAHVGWDGPAGNAPAWMDEFNTSSDIAERSVGNSCSALSSCSSQDFGETLEQASDMYSGKQATDVRNIRKKPKPKQQSSNYSPKFSSASTRSSPTKNKD